jgi:hypothetical protein
MIGKKSFPLNMGSGASTESEIICGWCGKVHNEGMDADNGEEGQTVRYFHFGKIPVVECCFDDFESTVISWFSRIVKFMKKYAKLSKKGAKKALSLAKQGEKALENAE